MCPLALEDEHPNFSLHPAASLGWPARSPHSSLPCLAAAAQTLPLEVSPAYLGVGDQRWVHGRKKVETAQGGEQERQASLKMHSHPRIKQVDKR